MTDAKSYSLTQRVGLLAGPLLFIVLLLLPAPEGLTDAAWLLVAVAALMVVWWVTEALPIAITSLLPLVLFPLLGILDISSAAAPYANPIIFLFLGGFIIALGIERQKLHLRIALNLIRLVGTNPNRIIFGFMLATALLSMWISNTATALMMLPIVLSVLHLFVNQDADGQITPAENNFAVAVLLAVAYGANIGGTATIIGTPPNTVLVGMLNEQAGIEITFTEWMIIGVPFALVMLAIVYLMLTRVLFPHKLQHLEGAKQLLEEQLVQLGPPTRGEKTAAAIFLLTALSWIFRGPLDALLPIQLNDSSIAILGGIFMFLVPIDWKKGEFVMEFKMMEKLPWGILLLFGGGLSLAAALDATGLVEVVGAQFTAFAELPTFVLLLIITLIAIFLTELMSNTALANIFIPVIIAVATAMGEEVVLMTVPIALAASCAFMLPIATPPNAIVFSSNLLQMSQMARAGFWLNMIATFVAVGVVYLVVDIIV